MQTLLLFGRREFGGQLGFTLVLHTWDQQLRRHLHLHGLMASGALAGGGSRWVAGGSQFLFSVRALSKVYRAKYLDLLERSGSKERLICHRSWWRWENRDDGNGFASCESTLGSSMRRSRLPVRRNCSTISAVTRIGWRSPIIGSSHAKTALLSSPIAIVATEIVRSDASSGAKSSSVVF